MVILPSHFPPKTNRIPHSIYGDTDNTDCLAHPTTHTRRLRRFQSCLRRLYIYASTERYWCAEHTFIFAILGPNHIGDGAAQLHKFRPRSHSSFRLLDLADPFPRLSPPPNSSRVRRKGLGTRLSAKPSAPLESSVFI